MVDILVIDSDPVQGASLVQALGGLGAVEHATSSLDALRALATRKFSVILLDLRVRPLDGFAILRALATKGGPNKDTQVYALAADVAEQDRALGAHAVFVLIKPIALSTLKNLVESGLNRPPPGQGIPARPRPPSGRPSPPPDKPTH
jgi:CheY-like chemotaxis protein